MPPPLLSLRDAMVTFGGRPLFDGVTLAIGRGERACLVGRNGTGKSTLLKAIAGQVELDAGERFVQPGTRLALLPQDPVFGAGETIAAHVAAGLPYSAEDDPQDHRIGGVLDRLSLDGSREISTLSGGEARRTSLARALVAKPDLLLLDEPTNHLDLPTILWLEEELRSSSGALLMVSHDRAFLRNLTRRSFWLDRGRLRILEEGFTRFEAWATAVLEAEEQAAHKLDRKIAAETHWLQRGVTARRKRNEGRLRRLKELRRQRAERIRAPGRAKLATGAAEGGGQLVVEAQAIGFRYPASVGEPEKIVVRDFSTRITRGDRIGVIGPNGSGKTTLLKLLTGQLEPESGTVRLGANLQPLYFDQRRAALDETATLWRTLLPAGGDSLMVRGVQKHVVAYLREFLFDERQALMPVSALSGGERARLLLAKLFAQPSNLLVLDEPTNDLDIETLDLLQEVLDEYEGTLLLVSHDRDFLDRLVTSVIAMEGDGRVREYAGGYSDYLRQRPVEPEPTAPRRAVPEPRRARPERGDKLRLRFRERRELQELPLRIEALEQEIAALQRRLGDAALYARDRRAFEQAATRHAAAQQELAAAETRWLELEEKRAAAAAARA